MISTVFLIFVISSSFPDSLPYQSLQIHIGVYPGVVASQEILRKYDRFASFPAVDNTRQHQQRGTFIHTQLSGNDIRRKNCFNCLRDSLWLRFVHCGQEVNNRTFFQIPFLDVGKTFTGKENAFQNNWNAIGKSKDRNSNNGSADLDL